MVRHGCVSGKRDNFLENDDATSFRGDRGALPNRPEGDVDRGAPAPGKQSGWGPAPDGTAPLPRRGQRGAVEDLLRKQFLLAPRLRCLWSHPAGLLPGGWPIDTKQFPQIQEYQFSVNA